MAEELKAIGGDLLKGLTGRQAYFLDVPSAVTSAALSVVSFKAVERLGEPYEVTIQLTHPLELDRSQYLGRDATLRIDAADGTEPRKFAGRITGFAKTRQTHDFCAYEMVVEPLVALLRLTHASRIYQHKTAPEIIEAILRRHDLKGHQFAFKTRRQYPQHKFRFQYQMSDWDYIRLLMEQEGLYSYFVPGKFGEMVVFGDDIDHYLYQPELRAPYRETAGLESGIETVFALQTKAKTVAASILAADRNPAQAYERFQAEANIARKDRTTYGQPYVYGTHHLDQASAKWEAQLRHEAAIAGQVVYEGESNVLELRPARILRMDLALPDAPNGLVVTEVTHNGARDQAYRNTFKAIPSDRRFRLPLDEANWPRIAGTLSARITSPSRYKYAYLTQDGHYTVRFDLDFDEWPAGGESVPLRLAKPFAGALQTGFHFPLIDGTEVAIAFTDGNPNKPYIAAAHHNSYQGDHVTSDDRCCLAMSSARRATTSCAWRTGGGRRGSSYRPSTVARASSTSVTSSTEGRRSAAMGSSCALRAMVQSVAVRACSSRQMISQTPSASNWRWSQHKVSSNKRFSKVRRWPLLPRSRKPLQRTMADRGRFSTSPWRSLRRRASWLAHRRAWH